MRRFTSNFSARLRVSKLCSNRWSTSFMLSTRFRLCASDTFVSKVIHLLLFFATGLLESRTAREVRWEITRVMTHHNVTHYSQWTVKYEITMLWNEPYMSMAVPVVPAPPEVITCVDFNRGTLWACAFQFFKSNTHYIGLMGLPRATLAPPDESRLKKQARVD